MRLFLASCALLLCKATFAQNSKIVITIEPSDCVACFASFSQFPQISNAASEIVYAIPRRYQPDSSDIFKTSLSKLPNIEAKIVWGGEAIIGKQDRLPTSSGVYFLNGLGKVLYKKDLKSFKAEDFFSSLYVNNIVDTIGFGVRVPNHSMQTASGKSHWTFIDDVHQDLIRIDLRNGTAQTLNSTAMIKESYKSLWGNKAIEQTKRLDDFFSNNTEIRRIQILSYSEGVEMGHGPVVCAQLLYPKDVSVRSFVSVMEISWADSGKVVKAYTVVDSMTVMIDKISRVLLKKYGLDTAQIVSDTSAVVTGYLNEVRTASDSISNIHTNLYTPFLNGIAWQSPQQALVLRIDKLKNSLPLARLSISSDVLIPEYKQLNFISANGTPIPYEKHNKFFDPLVRDQWIMNRHSFIIVDAKSMKVWSFPEKGTPYVDTNLDRPALYIEDFMITDSIVTVLYRWDSKPELKMISYDMNSGKVQQLDGKLAPYANVLEDYAEVRFAGPNILYVTNIGMKMGMRIFL